MRRRAGLLLLLLPAACATPYTPREKWDSFQPYASLRIMGLPAIEFLRSRSAFLVQFAVVSETTVRGSAVHVRLDAPPGSAVGLGMAVPITADGYYLTAAHCVSRRPPTPTSDGRFVVEKGDPVSPLWVVVTDGRRTHHGQAHLVWASDLGDLALIRSLALPFGVYDRFAEDVPDGAPLLAPGNALLQGPDPADPERYAGPSAGRALGRGATTADYAELRHDVPTSGGDSGGPLVTPDGALAGVVTRIMGGLLGRGDSFALRPRWEKIRSLVEADRRARKD